MLLLQFSTSHYCRKARLALGYKQINYQVENLNPGFHQLKVQPLTGLKPLPVLLPQESNQPEAIGDSTRILHYLEKYSPSPSWKLSSQEETTQAWLLEDWLDESIGTATRFVYYHFRSGEGKKIDPSLSSQLVINVVKWQYGIKPETVKLAAERLEQAMVILSRWQREKFLVGESLSVADISAAALLSPLGLIPQYREKYPWLMEKIREIHQLCGEPLPPGL